MTLYVGHLPAEALPNFIDDGQPMFPQGLDIKLDVWGDGTHEVAVRDMGSRRWLVPVALVAEPVAEVVEPTPNSFFESLAAALGYRPERGVER